MLVLRQARLVFFSKPRLLVPGAVGPRATTLVYNISANAWNTSKSELNTPRSDHCMTALNGKIYLAGRRAAECVSHHHHHSSSLKACQFY